VFTWACIGSRGKSKWSGRWESNPRLKLGKLGYYHYTTPAQVGFYAPRRGQRKSFGREAGRPLAIRRPPGPVTCRAGGKAGVDQLTSATAEGLTPVITVGVLSAVSDPSAPMANCDTVLSLMFVTYAY
jgi:hypothetical protein